MTPEVERHPPIYTQILDDIRGRITAGTLLPGDTVPSERKIAEEWGVGRGTGTRVIAALRSLGLVETIQGVGTVVSRDAAQHSARDRLVRARRTGRIYTPGEYAVIRSAGLVDAPDDIAGALGVDVGSPVIRRRRVTYSSDGRPTSASTSWFDGALAEVAPKLLSTERIESGTALYVEQVTGRRQATGRDFVYGRIATDDDIADLDVAEGTVINAGVNYVYDTDGAVVEYGEYAYPPGRSAEYEYEIN